MTVDEFRPTALYEMRCTIARMRAESKMNPWAFGLRRYADQMERLIEQAEVEHVAARREAALLALCSARARERGYSGIVL